MSLKDFVTDQTLEKNGVILDYGSFRVTIARAGGGNKRFEKIMERLTKPYRRALQTGTIDNGVALKLLKTGYAECIILNWETKVEEEWKKGIEDIIEGTDKLLPVTKDNILAVLEKSDDIFKDIQDQATSMTLFRQEIKEQEAKN